MGAIVATLLTTVGPILAKFIEGEQNQAAAKAELEAKISTALIDQQSQLYSSMAQVMAADAQSESWMTRNLRPFAGFWSFGMISLIVALAPFGKAAVVLSALKQIPDQLWTLGTVSIGAYVLARGAEKFAANWGAPSTAPEKR